MKHFGDDKERMWVAYLDGQLSAAESVAFENSLTEAERQVLHREVRMEHAVAEALAEGPACPDALWAAVTQQVTSGGRPRQSLLSRPWVVFSAFSGFAAAIAFTFLNPTPTAADDPVLRYVTDLSEFQDQSSTGADVGSVERFMRQRDVQLVLSNFTGSATMEGHQVELVGASEQGCHGRSLMEIRFECCGHPVKVLVAEKGTSAAELILKGERRCVIHYVREVSDYVMGVVSKHTTPDLTHCFEAQSERLAQR